MSCVKKEILIGGKGREDHYVRLEKREKGEYKKHPTWGSHLGQTLRTS